MIFKEPYKRGSVENQNAGGARLVVRLFCKQKVAGSRPVSSSRKMKYKYAVVAQLIERFTCNEDVAGLIPVFGSKN